MAGTETIKFNNIVIHSNLIRARQQWPDAISLTNTSPNIDNIKKYIFDGDPNAKLNEHANGNPAVCMNLEIGDFFRQADNTVGCTVFAAGTQISQFPGPAVCTYSPAAVWGDMPTYSVQPVNHWFLGTSVAGQSDPSAGIPPLPYEPYNTSNSCDDFQPPFTVIAKLCEGVEPNSFKVLSTATLLTKPYGDGRYERWPKCSPASTNGWGYLKSDIVISGKLSRKDAPVFLIIYVNCQCNCNQTGISRPTWAADVTAQIPEKPSYIWRRFGTDQTEDPEGYQIALAKLGVQDVGKMMDGDWHLVRPFYTTKQGRWQNVEGD